MTKIIAKIIRTSLSALVPSSLKHFCEIFDGEINDLNLLKRHRFKYFTQPLLNLGVIFISITAQIMVLSGKY